MLPLSVQKLDKKEMNERYQRITQALNIFEISDKYPSDISGGQRQRTSAARAFITYPKIIFADEPTGALDSKIPRFITTFSKINELYNATIVMVTHDPLAASFSERVIMLKDGRYLLKFIKVKMIKMSFTKRSYVRKSILGGMMYEF